MTIRPYKRKAQFYETDQMGIIHHANYIHWFEEARVDYMEQMGFSYRQANEMGIDFALLGISCEYKSMVRFQDAIDIYVAVTKLDEMRMTVEYRVMDENTGKLRAMGESRHCFYSSKRNRPVSLKREIPELFLRFQELTGNCTL